MVNTPGVGGYLLAWLVSVLAFSVELAVLWDDGTGGLWDGFVFLVWLVGLASLPFAAVGVPVVHFMCRAVEAQAVHVLAAGAVGWLSLGLLPVLAGDPGGVLAGLALAGPAALGRLAVVPLVWDRRRNSAAAALTG